MQQLGEAFTPYWHLSGLRAAGKERHPSAAAPSNLTRLIIGFGGNLRRSGLDRHGSQTELCIAAGPGQENQCCLGTGFRDSTRPQNRDTEVIQVHFCGINTAIAMPSRPSCGYWSTFLPRAKEANFHQPHFFKALLGCG
jgi:hypothetical protein